MISLIDFTSILNESVRVNPYLVYIKGGISLANLFHDMLRLKVADFIKVAECVKVKKLYPVQDDIFVELDGVEIVPHNKTFRFKYTCLEER